MASMAGGVRAAGPGDKILIDQSEMENKPGHLIRLAHQRMNAIFSEATVEFDITPTQHLVLGVLQRHGSVDLSALSALTTTDRATIGNVVNRLSEKGLVTVRPAPADRRVKEITLTSGGVELLEKAAERISHARDVLLSPLAEGEQETLMRLLRKLVGRAALSASAAADRRERSAAERFRVLLSANGNPVGAALALRLRDEHVDLVDIDEPESSRAAGGFGEPGVSVASLDNVIVVSRIWPGPRENELEAHADLGDLMRAIESVECLWAGGLEKCPVVLSLLVGRVDGRISPALVEGLRAVWFGIADELTRRTGETRVHAVVSGLGPAVDRRHSPLELTAAVTQAVDLAIMAVDSALRVRSAARIDVLDR